jgi:hypothetical protein
MTGLDIDNACRYSVQEADQYDAAASDRLDGSLKVYLILSHIRRAK